VAHLDRRLLGPHPAGSKLEVVLRGQVGRLASDVRAAGGRVVASSADSVTAEVPAATLGTLAQAPGVSLIAPPVRAYVDDTISQGVGASNATAWHTAGDGGVNVKVAIVDIGFANLATERSSANDLADAQITYVDNPSDPNNQNHCVDDNGAAHGTAVAEIVHQLAPSAQLYLYCIDDSNGFQQSGSQLKAAGVKIVNSSLSFPGDSRGDGTGSASSTAATVRTARQQGILWIESAGNEGQDHWGGTAADADGDGVIDLVSPTNNADVFGIPSGSSGAVVLQYDQWPTSNAPLSLAYRQIDFNGNPIGGDHTIAHQSGTSPVISECFEANPNGDGCALLPAPANDGTGIVWFEVAILTNAAPPHVRYDLTYWGDVTNNTLSCGNANCATVSSQALAESISEPASSPYALAVGAVDVTKAQACESGVTDPGSADGYPLEPFSSQGPTIDGRVKPDLVAYDGTAGNIFTTFCGTSASAPHVAGAAALVAGVNPTWDAAQLQNYLEQQASEGNPVNPPNNYVGHGALWLGDPAASALPATSGYAALASPQRILDTRTGLGGRTGALGQAQAISVTVPNVPSGATAVAINLTGTQATGSTYLSVFPSSFAGTSNLNLSTTDSTAAVFANVPLGPGNTIKVRNNAFKAHAIVDVEGFFVVAAGDGYAPVSPTRIFDTRPGTTSPPANKGQVGNGQTVTVTPPSSLSLPADTSSVVVNITVADQHHQGVINASPDGASTAISSTLNYTQFVRANLAVVGLSGGSFKIYNSGGPVDIIVDIVGYFAPEATSRYVPVTPVRIVDSRTGNGGRHAPLGQAATMIVQGGNIFDVPYAATALFSDVVAVPKTGSSFLAVYPGTTRPAAFSTVNFTAPRIVPNAAIANLTSSGTATIYNNAGSSDVVVDLFGYFI
jgi:Subtilase family